MSGVDPAHARLIEALHPWREQIVWVGGVAHQLHRLHDLADPPDYEPIRTRDGDLALNDRARLTGNIGAALKAAGFIQEFMGTDEPPVTHYRLADDPTGFYAEFIVPLRGSVRRKDGTSTVATAISGVTAQRLRHVDLLLTAPWEIHVPATGGTKAGAASRVRVVNAVSFMAQKLLIHHDRKTDKQAQDALYLHDTLQLFGAQLDQLTSLWTSTIRPTVSGKVVAQIREGIDDQYADVSDMHRTATRIAVGRAVEPADLQRAIYAGLADVFIDAETNDKP